MKPIISILLLTLFAFACANPKDSKPGSEGQVVNNKESTYQNNPADTLGVLISTIEFKLKANKDELETFDDGIVPWISIENPKSEVTRLINADELVLPYQNATIIIDYPLNNPAKFDISIPEKGFTRAQLILAVSEHFHKIYKEEEETATNKTIPLDKREGVVNRNQTDGKYGIWGHDLSDLDLSSIDVYKNKFGKIYLVLGVES